MSFARAALVIPLLLSIAGCSGGATKEQAEAAKAIQATREWAEKASAANTAQKAKAEALKSDRDAIVRKAIDAMRKAAAESFGTKEAESAEITAGRSGIKDFGGERWKVTGLYVGPDDKGKRFKAPWTADIRLMFDSLQCTGISLGKREPAE